MFNLDFFIDESSFGMSQAIQKCMKLTKHPNFRKKFGEPGVQNLSQSTLRDLIDDSEPILLLVFYCEHESQGKITVEY